MNIQVLAFPIESAITAMALDVFERQKELIFAIAPVVFLARVLVNMAFFKSVRSYGDLLCDLVMMFVYLMLFPGFIDLITELPIAAHEFIQSSANIVQVESLEPTNLSVWESLFMAFSFLKTFALLAYWISYAVYHGILFILIAIAAWAILAGTLMNVRFLLPAFVFCLVLTSLWPVVWYAINYVILHIAENVGVIGANAMAFCGDLMRLAVPIYLIKQGWHSKIVSKTREAWSSVKTMAQKSSSGATSFVSKAPDRLAAASQALGFQHEANQIRYAKGRTQHRINTLRAVAAKQPQKIGPLMKSAAASSRRMALQPIRKPLIKMASSHLIANGSTPIGRSRPADNSAFIVAGPAPNAPSLMQKAPRLQIHQHSSTAISQARQSMVHRQDQKQNIKLAHIEPQKIRFTAATTRTASAVSQPLHAKKTSLSHPQVRFIQITQKSPAHRLNRRGDKS